MDSAKGESSVDYTDARFGMSCFKKGEDGVAFIDQATSYCMDNPSRGLCVVINNKKFDKQTEMSERTGTDVDATNLEDLFKSLGFTVWLSHNQTILQMTEMIKKASKEDHTKNDCFVLAVLSHGDNEILYGYDGTIKVDELLFPLKKSSSLVGKPKLIIIQACRGTNFDEGHEVAFDGGDNSSAKIPIEADYIYAFSTVPGYFAWRNSQKGSWFVQALVEVFQKHGHEQLDLLRLLTRVNWKVAVDFQSNAARLDMNAKKQVPYIASTLTKDFFLPPKKH